MLSSIFSRKLKWKNNDINSIANNLCTVSYKKFIVGKRKHELFECDAWERALNIQNSCEAFQIRVEKCNLKFPAQCLDCKKNYCHRRKTREIHLILCKLMQGIQENKINFTRRNVYLVSKQTWNGNLRKVFLLSQKCLMKQCFGHMKKDLFLDAWNHFSEMSELHVLS